jgi:glycosyltransferase involved in cell wall biosynthesis
MAIGVPVVGTEAGGLPEVIEDGVNGVLVPPRNPVALAGAIHHLLADPALRSRMGQAGRRRVRTEFSAARHARRIEGVYQALIS